MVYKCQKKVKKKLPIKLNFLSFQDIIMNFQKFWGKHGCVILQPYDMEVGAGITQNNIEIAWHQTMEGHTYNHQEDQQTVGMVKIQIDYNTIINIK